MISYKKTIFLYDYARDFFRLFSIPPKYLLRHCKVLSRLSLPNLALKNSQLNINILYQAICYKLHLASPICGMSFGF